MAGWLWQALVIVLLWKIANVLLDRWYEREKARIRREFGDG